MNTRTFLIVVPILLFLFTLWLLVGTSQKAKAETVVFNYSGTGETNTPQFNVNSTPWLIEFVCDWDGEFRVSVWQDNPEEAINRSVTTGVTYVNYLYDSFGPDLHFDITDAPPNGNWTLTVIENPDLPEPPQGIDFQYTGIGEMNTPPFEAHSSPWLVEFICDWDGEFEVHVEGNGSDQAFDRSIASGITYIDYVYDITGSNLYFKVFDVPPNGSWNISVVDNPDIPEPPAGIDYQYSGIGEMNTPPFEAHSSPWLVEFTCDWDGELGVYIMENGLKAAINQSVASGEIYVSNYLYGITGPDVHFHVWNTPADGNWTLTVIENPDVPVPPPGVAFQYSGTGNRNTSPFGIEISPWLIEFTCDWDGLFRVNVEGDDSGQVISQSVSAGIPYTSNYIYGITGSTLYFETSKAPDDGNWTLSVVGEPKEYTINFGTNWYGWIDPSGQGTVSYIDNVINVIAIPNIGCRFHHWDVEGGVYVVEGNQNGQFTIIGDGSITANFCLAGTIAYVNASASGSNTGINWDNAFTDLQDALNVAIPGKQVWVAAGTYVPTVTYGGTSSKYQSFQMKNGVELYGGFPCDGDPSWEQRDYDVYKTVLSGEIGNPGTITDNCYHVFYHPDSIHLDNTSILDGFTITAGNSNGKQEHWNGGGMYNSGSSSPSIINCTFVENQATGFWGDYGRGGAMYNSFSSPYIFNCVFLNNRATHNLFGGGGIFNYHSSSTITDCLFIGNTTISTGNQCGGGGMYNSYSDLRLINCTFDGNYAEEDGGGMLNSGNPSPTLIDCVFIGNIADDDGAGIFNRGSSPKLVNCLFCNNSTVGNGDHGGGMYNWNSASPKLENCVFTGNQAYHGGGIYNDQSFPIIANSIFSDNNATVGGGIFNRASEPILTNSVFFDNVATMGAAMYSRDMSSPLVTNCVFWCSGGITDTNIIDEFIIDSGTPAITYCNIKVNPGSPVYPGKGNISSDPLWVNSSNGDFHLLPDSPCIDAGTNTAPNLIDTDYEGDPRIVNGRVDMGVDEVTWVPWSCLEYDNNLNGKIEYAEMVDALMDYLTDKITFGQMIDVLMMYLVS